MFKRLRWTTFGAVAGAGGMVWAQWRVRRSVGRYLPDQIGSELRRRVGRTGSDLRAAVDEGRAAMAEREAELRALLPDPTTPPPRKGPVIEARVSQTRRLR